MEVTSGRQEKRWKDWAASNNMTFEVAWAFVIRFRRNPDQSLHDNQLQANSSL
jgi:hypothetical protein